jgi:LysR family glycine cleavage system transcriptional activator
MQVRNLEDWLGLKLFSRRANRIRLTDAGREYYQNAASALTGIAGFTQTLTEGSKRQTLVISATPALAQLWLPERLAQLQQVRPALSVRLRIEDDAMDLEEAGIDARLTYGGEHPDYRTTELFTDQLVVVAAQPDMTPQNNRLISVDWGRTISSVPGWSQYFAACEQPVPDQPMTVAPSVPSAVAVVQAGIGVALLPVQVVAGEFQSGRLVKTSDFALSLPRPYVMVYANHKARLRRLQALSDALKVRSGAKPAAFD